MISIEYDTLQKIINLNDRRAGMFTSFSANTCCDYVDSIHYDGKRWEVVMFVEPCGNASKSGDSLDAVLDWWIEVFSTQPTEWDYIKAGWHLWGWGNEFPDDVPSVWKEHNYEQTTD